MWRGAETICNLIGRFARSLATDLRHVVNTHTAVSCVVASISAAVHYWQGNKRTHTNADMPNSLMIIMVLC